MERNEPSLIPEWLKGASGSALASPHSAFFQEDGGSTQVFKPRPTQQVAGGHTVHDSPRGAASSSEGRRNHGSYLLDRTMADRDILSQGRLHSNLTRSSSSKQGFAFVSREKEWEGNRPEVIRERDWVQDGERSLLSREVESLSGVGSDGKRKEWDLENGRVRSIIPGKAGNYDSDVNLRRPQLMVLSPRLSDNSTWKGTEGATASLPVPSVSGELAISIQKAVFERNFPSLGIDDKPVGLVGSSMNNPIASLRTFWLSPARSDLGRASSPGLVGDMGGLSAPSLSNGGSGGSDSWNSVLAEVLPLNDNTQTISSGMSALSCSSSSSLYAATSSVPITAATMNMAEALSQPPLRVRTPPQSAAESQRLEELALKQSRQLIPMTPSLPKTMSLSEKGKSKTNRTVDPSRSSSSSRPDTLKHNQGKRFVLKATKDAGLLATIGLKSEGNSTAQLFPQGMVLGASAQQRKIFDRRGSQPAGSGCIDTMAGVRSRDLMDDKRSSIQSQNRSDFFNTLRKKAANIAPKLDSCQLDRISVSSDDAVLAEASTPTHISGAKLGGDATDRTSLLHSNGGPYYVSRKGSISGEGLCIDCGSPEVQCAEEIVTVDSEEEEAAFMRSLGWEEDAEDSELTEEEINAFYQMQARRKILGIEACSDVRVEPSVNNNTEIYSSSSDTESDDELPAQMCR